MINPLDPKHRQRLYSTMTGAFRSGESYRRTRAQHIQSYAGTEYGRSMLAGNAVMPYINILQQTAEAYSVALAYNCPQVRFNTTLPNIEPYRIRFQEAINNHIKRITLADEIRAALTDAFFRVGVVRSFVGADPQALHAFAPESQPGSPQAKRVSLDHLCLDMRASDLRRMSFTGDRFLVPFSEVMESPHMDKQAKRSIESRVAREDHTQDSSLAGYISTRGLDPESSYIEDMVWLANVYLPRERKILVVPVDRHFNNGDADSPPLQIMDWDAAATGPYSFLTFADVPDNAMPYSVSENLYGLFVLANNLMVKNAMRAKAQKDLFVYEDGSEDDLKRIKGAKDGEAIRVADLHKINQFKIGGVDGNISAMTANALDLFNRASGNVELMSGLGASAPTARQEALMQQQVGKREAELRRRTGDFVKSICNNIAEMIHDDASLIIPGRREIGSSGLSVDSTYWPEPFQPRPASYRDFLIEIETHAMEYRSPAMRLGQLREVFGMLSQVAPLLDAQNGMLDIREYIKLEAELGALPELNRIVRFNLTPQQLTADTGTELGAKTPREYIRHSVSAGPSSAGRQQLLAQQMQSNDRQVGMQSAM